MALRILYKQGDRFFFLICFHILLFKKKTKWTGMTEDWKSTCWKSVHCSFNTGNRLIDCILPTWRAAPIPASLFLITYPVSWFLSLWVSLSKAFSKSEQLLSAGWSTYYLCRLRLPGFFIQFWSSFSSSSKPLEKWSVTHNSCMDLNLHVYSLPLIL